MISLNILTKLSRLKISQEFLFVNNRNTLQRLSKPWTTGNSTPTTSPLISEDKRKVCTDVNCSFTM